jgi:hypothetical protein
MTCLRIVLTLPAKAHLENGSGLICHNENYRMIVDIVPPDTGLFDLKMQDMQVTPSEQVPSTTGVGNYYKLSLAANFNLKGGHTEKMKEYL